MVAAHRAQDWPRFLALARQAAAASPEDVRALHNLACAEAKSGHPKKSAETWTRLRNDPRFDEPTLATVVGHDLYVVARSQWPAFEPKVFDPAKLKEPLVLRIPLGAAR